MKRKPWPAASAPESRRCPVRAMLAQSAWAASQAAPVLHAAPAVWSSPPLGTCQPCPCKTPAAGRTAPHRPTADACSPHWSRDARSAPTTGWWHRQSSKSDKSVRRVPPANHARWCPTALVHPSDSAAASTDAPPPHAVARLSITPLSPSIAAGFPCSP